MSRRAAAAYQPEPYGSYRAATAHARALALVQRAARGDYTFAHAGHQVRIGPIAFWIVVGTLVIMGAWSIATATYFAFHDDVLTRLIARQATMQVSYEDRIADLRARIDRITSRQLLDQEKFEQNLSALLQRQTALERRAGALATIADPGVTGSIKTPQPRPGRAKPAPINESAVFVAPPDREARLQSRLPMVALRTPAGRRSGGLMGDLARVQASLDRLAARQTQALDGLETRYDGKARRIRTVLADLGLDPAKLPTGPSGGPFVPVKPHASASAFDRQIYRVAVARAQADRLSRALTTVPLRKPIHGAVSLSSGFGVRVDPFLDRPAMHTGLDFRGDTGEPVYATAAGKVVTASWNGGYGRMIEIDHGNGLATRYGHLSKIEVRVGERVRIGERIGLIGSTGRSTGPHLHYETRIDGEPVDPQKFLRAGIRLGSAL